MNYEATYDAAKGIVTGIRKDPSGTVTLIAKGVKNGVKNTIDGVAQALENPEASGELVFNTSTMVVGGPAGGVGKIGTAFQGSGKVVMSLKGAGGKSIGAIADVLDDATDIVKSRARRGSGGRGGGPDHAPTQEFVQEAAGGREEAIVRLGDSGRYRIVDVMDAQDRYHQIGDMRWWGGLRPSTRERGAIEDLRKTDPNATIIYHDKRGKLPSLVNPDLQADWRAAPERHRYYE